MWVWAGQCWVRGGTGAGADKMGGPVWETCLLVNVLAVGNSLALEADLVLVALDSFGPLLMEVVHKAVFSVSDVLRGTPTWADRLRGVTCSRSWKVNMSNQLKLLLFQEHLPSCFFCCHLREQHFNHCQLGHHCTVIWAVTLNKAFVSNVWGPLSVLRFNY